MVMSSPAVYVAVDINGVAREVGTLRLAGKLGKQTTAFTYEPSWLADPAHFALAPAVPLTIGAFYPQPGIAVIGALGDSAPDRWGRTLMRRREWRRAEAETRSPRTLSEIDFVLGVTDVARQGALRFRVSSDGPFVAPEEVGSIPPLVSLPKLLNAAEAVLNGNESDEELQVLLAPGSSLGGARPKASVRDSAGSLLIAKFPKPDDDYRVVAWESVALSLAELAGIRTTGHQLERIVGQDVLLIRRFDRVRVDAGEWTRVPYLSAMSMLDAKDGDTRSYVEIADALQLNGASTRQDLLELFRRVVFSVLISNTDDHLRNHGFLYAGTTGWRLSPAFDLNPVPVDISPRVLSTPINDQGDPSASVQLALDHADYFSLSRPEAVDIARQVAQAVSAWRAVAARAGISARERARMQSAFEHPELDRVL